MPTSEYAGGGAVAAAAALAAVMAAKTQGANERAAAAGSLAACAISEKLGVLCARYVSRAREALDWYARTAATAQTLPGDDAAFVRATRAASGAGGGGGSEAGGKAGAATSALSDGDAFYGGDGIRRAGTAPHVLSAGLWAALGLEDGPTHIPLLLADRLALSALRPPSTFFAQLGGAPGARASARASAAAAGVAAFNDALLSQSSVSRAVAARRVDAMLGAAEVAAAGTVRPLEEHEEALETYAWDTSEWCWSERVGGGGDETALAAALSEASLGFSALPLPGRSVFSHETGAASAEAAPLAVLATRLDECARIALAFSVLTPRLRALRGPPAQDVAAILARTALRPQLGQLLPPQTMPPLHSHLLDLAAPPLIAGGGEGDEDAVRNAPRITLFPSDGSFIVVTPTEGVAYTGAVRVRARRKPRATLFSATNFPPPPSRTPTLYRRGSARGCVRLPPAMRSSSSLNFRATVQQAGGPASALASLASLSLWASRPPRASAPAPPSEPRRSRTRRRPLGSSSP